MTLRWIPAAALMMLALLWPALWNGFPIVFHDTGGYLDSYMTGLLANGRSAIYGLFLRLGLASSFWVNVVFQSAVVVWLLVLTLRVHGFGGRPWLAATVTLGLGTLTSLPWYAAQLMPDVWLPAGMLALYLLAFRGKELRQWEKFALGAVPAFAAAGHMATLALLVGLLIPLALWRVAAPRLHWPCPAVAAPALAVIAGVLLILFGNLAITGHFTFIPGGPNFLFGRLIQTGIAARYLADHCPDPSLRVCAYRDELPADGDYWLWNAGSPLWKMGGGWEGFEDEARRIVLDSLRKYPGLHLRAAVEGASSQLVMVKSGDYLSPWTWHTRFILEKYAPAAYPDFLAARQQQAEIDFSWVNAIHVPVALGAMAGLPAVVLLAGRRRIPRTHAALALMLLVALLGNAVVCGVLSNPHDRYQSRLVALAPLALVIAALGWRRISKMAA
ncbi:MAG: hypothetical protein WD039_00755 [Xanthobacteraceae bacterium]